MNCPKCGNEQVGTLECDRCGIIFEKYQRKAIQNRQPRLTPEGGPPSRRDTAKTPESPGPKRIFYGPPKPWWSPEGRIGRKLFFLWWFSLVFAALTVLVIALSIGSMIVDEELGYAILLIGACLVVVAALILQSIWIIKRLHDLGKSGRWCPVYTLLLLPLVYLFLVKGQDEENKYGPPYPERETP